jgi:hypothetical protein
MSNEDMVTEALRQAQQLSGDAEAFEAASQEPSLPAAAADEATMAMPASEMFDDED